MKNVGLGEAAKRGVGMADNQLPDMSSFKSILAGNGFMCLPGGLIIQWGAGVAGTGVIAASGNAINFPIAYTSQCFQVCTSYDNGGGQIIAGAAGSFSTRQFLLRCDAVGGNYNFRWFAVGL